MNIRLLVIEALKASEFREIMSIGRELANERINQIWPKLEALSKFKSKRADRLYYDYDVSLQQSSLTDTSKNVILFLEKNGYKITNYLNGFAEKDNKSQKISKILLDLIKQGVEGAQDTLKLFNKDEYRSGKGRKMLLVLSRHPYDIAGSSTDRGWTSCMNLRGGLNSEYVAIDVSKGTIVSYLIDENDLNINNPIARILIKPFLEVDDHENILYGIENGDVKYGSAGPAYPKTLLLLFDKVQGEKTGFFKIAEGLYNDGVINKTHGDLTPEQILFKRSGVKNYEKHEDGTISVFGDVDMTNLKLSFLPVTFKYCSGNFKMGNNKFTSLKNVPIKIDSNFICSENKLTSLENGPKYVGKHYLCWHNQLKSLKGSAEYIGGNFSCNANYLETLNFGPSKVHGHYICDFNQLKSLYGCAKIIGGYFDCSDNQLSSLVGGPEIVGEHYYCSNNNLIDLVGAPKIINKNFNVISNKSLMSLKGLPERIGGNFYIKDTQLAKLFTDEQIRQKCEIVGRIIR